MLRESTRQVALAIVLLVTIGCYEEETLGTLNKWHNSTSARGESGKLSNFGSFLEAAAPGSAGLAVAGVGDVDGDGLDDILLGDPFLWKQEGGQECEGLEDMPGGAYLVYGRAAGMPDASTLGDADAVFIGEFHDDLAGFEVSEAGDVNGDGFADFLIPAIRGAWDLVPEAFKRPPVWRGLKEPSKAYLYYGSADRLSGKMGLDKAPTQFLVDGQHRMVWQALGVGDLNGDGWDEVGLVVAYSHNYPKDTNSRAASAHIFFGKNGGLSAKLAPEQADLSIEPDLSADPEARIDFSLAFQPLGDVNGDGFDDLAIGRVDSYETSEEWVVTGAEISILLGQEFLPTGTADLSEATQIRLGNDTEVMVTAVSGIGDLNNDGVDDIAVGDWISEGNSWSGRYRSSYDDMRKVRALYVFLGGDRFQSSTAESERADIAITGADTVISYDIDYGSDVLRFANAGDVDGDHFDDLLIGRRFHDKDQGMVALFFGGSTFGGEQLTLGQADTTLFGTVAGVVGSGRDEHAFGEHVGEKVAGAGDFNGDGFGDFLVGAPAAGPELCGGITGGVYLVPGGP